jgi:hypothetical protein
MARRRYWIFGCAILSAAAIYWTTAQVNAQTPATMQNSTTGPDIETKGRLRSITNADRIAAAKRAAEARATKATEVSNTTAAEASNTTAPASETTEGGSK